MSFGAVGVAASLIWNPNHMNNIYLRHWDTDKELIRKEKLAYNMENSRMELRFGVLFMVIFIV